MSEVGRLTSGAAWELATADPSASLGMTKFTLVAKLCGWLPMESR
jgi:hypothetical protein